MKKTINVKMQYNKPLRDTRSIQYRGGVRC